MPGSICSPPTPVSQPTLVAETGKPVREARAEIAGAVDALLLNAGPARFRLGTAGSPPDGTHAHLVREPVGPTAFITPWSRPSFAAGVSAVVEPSPQTSRVTRQVLCLATAGLSADWSRAMAVAREISAGTVWINCYHHSYAGMPSGRMRMSGLGRTRGVDGLIRFTEQKHIQPPVPPSRNHRP